MKYFVLISFLIGLVGLQSVYSQTLFDQYRMVNTDEDSARIDGLILELMKNPNERALFIIYTGKDKHRLGSVMPYVTGVKQYLSLREFSSDRISFAVAQGKEYFKREIWIIKDGDKLPEFETENFEFSRVEDGYLFAAKCYECDPAVSTLRTDGIDWELLAKLLKENPEYKVLIELAKKVKYYDAESKKMIRGKKFIKKFRKGFSKRNEIDIKRIEYKMLKSKYGEFNIFIEN